MRLTTSNGRHAILAVCCVAALAACGKKPPPEAQSTTPPVPEASAPAPAPVSPAPDAPSAVASSAGADSSVASGVSRNLAGTVDLVDGESHVMAPDKSTRSAQVGDKIFEGDLVTTEAGAELHIQMADGGFIAIRPNTALSVTQYQANGDAADHSAISLVRGSLRSITGWIGKAFPQNYAIYTPDATIGVRGTDHETAYLPEASGDTEAGTYDTVHAGATTLSTASGKVDVSPEHAGFIGRSATGPPRLLQRVPAFFSAPHRNEARLAGMNTRIGASYEQRRAARALEHAQELRRGGGPAAHAPGVPAASHGNAAIGREQRPAAPLAARPALREGPPQAPAREALRPGLREGGRETLQRPAAGRAAGQVQGQAQGQAAGQAAREEAAQAALRARAAQAQRTPVPSVPPKKPLIPKKDER